MIISCLKKQYTSLSIITLANVDRFVKFVHYQIPEESLYSYINNILHLTLTMFLHYLKLWNLKKLQLLKISVVAYCLWDLRILFILQDVMPP